MLGPAPDASSRACSIEGAIGRRVHGHTARVLAGATARAPTGVTGFEDGLLLAPLLPFLLCFGFVREGNTEQRGSHASRHEPEAAAVSTRQIADRPCLVPLAIGYRLSAIGFSRSLAVLPSSSRLLTPDYRPGASRWLIAAKSNVSGSQRLAPPFVQPFLRHLVVSVVGIGHDRYKIVVPPDAADVVRRAGRPASEADRVGLRWLRRAHRLDQDLVVPAITKVVHVAEARAGVGHDVRQPRLVLVFVEIVDHVRIGVAHAVDGEIVKVVVVPTHHVLQNEVQVSQGDVAGHHDAAPDRRLAAAERDFQAMDRRGGGRTRCFRGHHAPSSWLSRTAQKRS